jgi:hypothetical protein
VTDDDDVEELFMVKCKVAELTQAKAFKEVQV